VSSRGARPGSTRRSRYLIARDFPVGTSLHFFAVNRTERALLRILLAGQVEFSLVRIVGVG